MGINSMFFFKKIYSDYMHICSPDPVVWTSTFMNIFVPILIFGGAYVKYKGWVVESAAWEPFRLED